MVMMISPGSRPGMMNFAKNPATNPNRIQKNTHGHFSIGLKSGI
jgi:hypothetical protein